MATEQTSFWKGPLLAFGRGVAIVCLTLGCTHLTVLMCTSMAPVPAAPPQESFLRWSGGIRQVGQSYVKHHGKILQVGLAGSPQDIGYAQARLLYPEMIENERALWSVFDDIAPFWPLRVAVLDLAQVRFRNLAEHFPQAYCDELAASASAFHPDPFYDQLPTWQRFLFLNSLYDISLSFEHSPLIGCSSVALSGARAADGHTMLARNFDFETHEVFDLGKAVMLVREQGKIPFASVAWPGLIGVVTGINARGVGIVVHGGRARSPSAEGEPVLLTVRQTLSEASSAEQAAFILATRPAMVSHLVLIADALGSVLVVERAPQSPAHVRRAQGFLALTNHFEGPLASDPANLRVRANTSTLQRRARLDELISLLDHPATPADLLTILRDKSAVGGQPLAVGDRRAIDAGIATHGVVMDLSARRMWVSQGPHLTGSFVRFDVARLLEENYDPEIDEPTDPLP